MTGPTTTYRLDLPRYDIAWEVIRGKRKRLVWDTLRGNSRPGHWAIRHRAVKQVITDVADIARLRRVPAGKHLTVRLHWAPGDRRVADVDNLVALQKVMCDALARGRKDLPGLHLVPDDRPQHMTKLMPEILPPPENGLWLTVKVA
jgi:crossover junction endodeoxyribonuclease RusA